MAVKATLRVAQHASPFRGKCSARVVRCVVFAMFLLLVMAAGRREDVASLKRRAALLFSGEILQNSAEQHVPDVD